MKAMKKSIMMAVFAAAFFFVQTGARAESGIVSSTDLTHVVLSANDHSGNHPGKKHRHRKHRKAVGLKKAIILKRRGLGRFH
jgi:hypothetical protein